MGEHVYLRVKPQKSTLRTVGCAQLAPRFYEPFEILNRVVPVAYQLDLPSHIKVHNVDHVSLLKKYVHLPSHIVEWNVLQVEQEGDFLPESLLNLE